VPTHSGGLEREFIDWLDKDTHVEAFAKVHEYRHTFLRRPYLKADGMPAQYSPDFLVRTDTDVYVVETKAQSALNDENVNRKKRAALAWCEQINQLDRSLRADLEWHYVLLGEAVVHEWHSKNARASELLEYARLRRTGTAEQGALI
jgi:type III restriction enzyme